MRSHSSSKVCSSVCLRADGRYRSAILTIGFLALVTPAIWAQDAVLTDDAHVSTTTPNTADGSGQIIRVRGGIDRAFLKFSVNAALFPSGTVGMFVGKATLRVFVNTVNVPGVLQVAPASAGTAWSETTLTNVNAPALGASAAVAGVAAGEKWVTFDVTSLVQQWINNPASNNGLALFGTGTTDIEIDAKEDIPFIFGGGLVLSGHPAQLEITLNHAATADAASLAANATSLGGAPASSYVQSTSPLLTGPRTPLPGSPSYIQNTTLQQPLANFNISGNGTLGGTLSADTLNAGTQFNLNGAHFISTNGFQSTFVGTRAGGLNSGAFNTFLGTLAGMSNSSGTANTFVGDTAGENNTTAFRNSYFGSGAGALGTTGGDNSYFGYHAGLNSSGFQNSFFGASAGEANTSGIANTFVGVFSGSQNTSGLLNTFVGASSGFSNTIGGTNNFFGQVSGASNTTGSSNNFFGYAAGFFNTIGSNNVFLGEDAGGANDAGGDNVFLGGFSAPTNTSGSNNTVVGAAADVGANNLSFATAVGAGAVVNTSNTITLGRSAGQDTVQVPGALSVNTFSANILNAGMQFDLAGTRLLTSNPSVLNIAVGGGLVATGANNSLFGTRSGLSITSGNANAFFGDTAGQNTQDGSRNSFYGSAAGFLNRSGNDNSFLGFFAGSANNGSNNSFFGSRAGRDTDSGFNNSFFGAFAGVANTGGGFNAFFGDSAGASSTFAFSNSFFGSGTGSTVTFGEGNSFLGTEAGNSVTTGNYNSVVGTFAGSNFDSTMGSGNVLVGGFSDETFWDFLYDPSFFTGPSSQNVFVGLRSGHGNTTGSSNTLLGSLTDVGANNLSFATAIGAGAMVNTSNTIALGRSIGADTVQIPGMVAIGLPAAASPLTVLGLIETDSAAGGIKFPDGSVQRTAGITGNVVKSLNGLFNDVTLRAGSPNVMITQAGNSISIAAHADETAILNQTTLQSPANFNIDGTGTVGKLFAPQFVASGDYREAGGDTSILNDIGGNLRVGPNAGIGPTGSLNTYVGFDAGSNSVAPGDQNSFLGYHAGQGASSGDGGNTFAGAFSGPLNHGDNNSYFGRNTGLSNDTGSNNTLIGANANVAVAGLSNATALGSGAIVGASDSLVLGNNVNVGIGTPIPTSRLTVAGFVETTIGGVKFPDGSIQTTAAAGAGPFVRSVNGLNNDVVLAAGSNVTITPSGNTLTISAGGGGGGSGNAILNQLALQSGANFNIDGNGKANIFDALTQYNLGGAKVMSIPGQDNLFVGAGAGSVPSSFGDNIENVFVGTQAGPRTTECCNAFFGNYTGKVNTTGQSDTFLGYQAGVSNTQGSDNTFVGTNSGASHTSGDGNTFIGDSAGVTDFIGLNNTYIGRGTGGQAALTGPHPGTPGAYNTFLGTNATATQPANLTYATAIGSGAVVDDNNKVVLGRTNDVVSVPGTFTNPSDLRLKTRIADLNYGLNEILKLRPVSWSWKSDPGARTQMGLIAQEVRPLIPELVIEGGGKEHLLSMNYLGLMPILVRAIQQQQETIDQLRSQLARQSIKGSLRQEKQEAVSLASVIDGSVTTDGRGDAVVVMPSGFDSSYGNFRYQLTVMGQFAQAIIASEISNNRFSIKTDKPGVKVSWQVTARRNEPMHDAGGSSVDGAVLAQSQIHTVAR